jgi:molybdate transport system substrate-binding protein
LFFSAGISLAGSEGLTVAVAANFYGPMEEVVRMYEAEQGVQIKTNYSSTGKFYAQLQNGAPFDLFLAADTKRPAMLYQSGVCLEPLTYARGRVVLWSGRTDLDGRKNWQEIINDPRVKRIALPNPMIAPYGEAAAGLLEKNSLHEKIKDKLVYAGNVAQAFQYGQQGAVDVTFTALSYALSDEGKRGARWPLPEAEPVIQQGCVMKSSNKVTAAQKFLSYLTSEPAKNLIRPHGYR